MNNQSILKDFIRYVAMNVASMIGLSIYILADTFFISNSMGANGLAALNIAIPVYNLINGLGLMLGIGGASRFILFRVGKNRKGSDRLFTTVFSVGLMIGLVIMLAAVLFSRQVAAALGADETILESTAIYMKVMCIFAPAFISNNILSFFVKNDGQPKLAMIGMLCGSAFNIIFDYVFMFPLHMGMFGAALATAFSPVMGLLVLQTHLRKGKAEFGLLKTGLAFHYLPAVFAAGVPSFVIEMASGIVMIVFNKLIFGLAGNNGIAAYGIMANLLLVIMAVYNGVAQGSQPLFGETYANDNKKELHSTLRYAVVTVTLLSIVFYALTFGFSNQLASIFNSEGNMVMQTLAVSGFPLFFGQCFFLGMNVILIMYLISIERPLIAQILSLLKGFFIVVPLAFVLAHFLGMNGIWVTMTTTEFIVFVLSVISLLNKKSEA